MNENERLAAGEEAAVSYKPHPALYALFALVIGYLFVRMTFGRALGIGVFTFTVIFLLFAVSFRAVHNKGEGRVGTEGILGILLILLLGGVQLVSDNSAVNAIAYYVEINTVLYWLTVFYGNRESRTLDGDFFLDSLKARWVMPFGSFGTLFAALFGGGRRGKKSRILGYVLLGLLVALIPTAIVLFLLMSGDALFESFFESFFENWSETVFRLLLRLIFSIPVSLYIFGALWSNAEHKFGDILNGEAKERTRGKVRILHPVVSCTAISPVILLYGLYVTLHIGYYLSAFQNIVPQGYSTAEYARKGFFELVIIAVIDLGLIIAGSVFTKRREDGKRTLAWRIFAALLSLMTLALSASAISKMLLYIRLYGLTVKRVSTMWLMIFLILTFLYVIVRQFTEKCNVCRLTIVTGLLMLLVIGYVSADKLVAAYNVWAWKSGKLESVDVYAIGALSDEAAPYLIALAESGDEEVSAEANKILYAKSLEEKRSWHEENIPSLRAEKKISAYEEMLQTTGKQHNSAFKAMLVNHTGKAIKEVEYAYYFRGRLVTSGGVINADNTPFMENDAIWLNEIFDTDMVGEMHAEISVIFAGEEDAEVRYIASIDSLVTEGEEDRYEIYVPEWGGYDIRPLAD